MASIILSMLSGLKTLGVPPPKYMVSKAVGKEWPMNKRDFLRPWISWITAST
jgi:hypothetical protein